MLAYIWWRESTSFLSDSLSRCRIGPKVKLQRRWMVWPRHVFRSSLPVEEYHQDDRWSWSLLTVSTFFIFDLAKGFVMGPYYNPLEGRAQCGGAPLAGAAPVCCSTRRSSARSPSPRSNPVWYCFSFVLPFSLVFLSYFLLFICLLARSVCDRGNASLN